MVGAGLPPIMAIEAVSLLKILPVGKKSLFVMVQWLGMDGSLSSGVDPTVAIQLLGTALLERKQNA